MTFCKIIFHIFMGMVSLLKQWHKDGRTSESKYFSPKINSCVVAVVVFFLLFLGFFFFIFIES